MHDSQTSVILGFLWRWGVLMLSAANGGQGAPVFTGETDCTYYFNWETVFACVKEKEDLLCQVRDGKKHYDLSPLTRFPGEFSCHLWWWDSLLRDFSESEWLRLLFEWDRLGFNILPILLQRPKVSLVGVGEAVADCLPWIITSHWIVQIKQRTCMITADTNAPSLSAWLQARAPVQTGRSWMLSLQNQTLVST